MLINSCPDILQWLVSRAECERWSLSPFWGYCNWSATTKGVRVSCTNARATRGEQSNGTSQQTLAQIDIVLKGTDALSSSLLHPSDAAFDWLGCKESKDSQAPLNTKYRTQPARAATPATNIRRC